MLKPLSSTNPRRRGALSQGCLIGLVVVGILAVIVLIVGGMGVSQYNGMKAQKTVVDSKWAEIDNQYKRRNDLIPQIESVIKGSANFEQATLKEVIDARASATRMQLPEPPEDPAKLQAYIQAQQAVGGALSRLLAVAENYPDLKTSAQFRDLSVAIEGTENRIAVARRDYIDAVQVFNAKVATFPGNIIAGMFGMKELPQLQAATEQERSVPKIDFGTFGNDKK
jgi:LemA protein